jgi:hypothetical protein
MSFAAYPSAFGRRAARTDLEEGVIPPRLVRAWHGGHKLRGGKFDLSYLGRGEGFKGRCGGVLGPGIYFGSSPELARLYCKYAAKDSTLYEVELDTSDYYDFTWGLPLRLRGAVSERPRDLCRKFGADKTLSLLAENGIKGTWEKLPGGAIEFAVFDVSTIRILSSEPC